MTDKEVLEYSKQIIDAKKEIENSESAAPDLEDQVRNKFLEDSVNRARFIDSTLVIGGASKEFRNIFGVDAPHYELDKNCYLALDKNNNNHYEITDDSRDERIPVIDPMNENKRVKNFIDCWDMINAAKFDSTTIIPDYQGGSTKEPADRQRFFVDKRKREKGSPAHNPICPPGYDKWAGKVVYDYICKNFDLTETVLYKILSNPVENSLSTKFTLGTFDYNNRFDYNINENGQITKNNFVYNYDNDSFVMNAYSDPQFRLQREGCTPGDEHPIKWFEILVPVTSVRMNGTYYYTYNWNQTPFSRSKTPISSFDVITIKNERINGGYALFCLDPVQLKNLPTTGSKSKVFESMRFCVHVIYKENDVFDNGQDEEREHSFLWWSWSNTIKHSYVVTFSPIRSLSNNV